MFYSIMPRLQWAEPLEGLESQSISSSTLIQIVCLLDEQRNSVTPHWLHLHLLNRSISRIGAQRRGLTRPCFLWCLWLCGMDASSSPQMLTLDVDVVRVINRPAWLAPFYWFRAIFARGLEFHGVVKNFITNIVRPSVILGCPINDWTKSDLSYNSGSVIGRQY